MTYRSALLFIKNNFCVFKIIILSIIIPVLILGLIGFNPAFAQVDSTPPSFFIHNDVTIETLDPAGAVYSYTVTVTDDTDPSPAVSCTPGSDPSPTPVE